MNKPHLLLYTFCVLGAPYAFNDILIIYKKKGA